MKKKLMELAGEILRRHNDLLEEIEEVTPRARRERTLANYEEAETGFPREEETPSEEELRVLEAEDRELEDAFFAASEILRFERALEALEEGKGTACRGNINCPDGICLRAVKSGGRYILLYTEDEANVRSVRTVDEAVYMAARIFLPEETADWPLPAPGEGVTA